MAAYLIGVDMGTQGTKTCLYQENGVLISTAFQPSRLIETAPGAVEQDPEEMLVSVTNTIREVMQKSCISPHNIAAVGMAGQMAGIIGIDQDFNAVTPYDSWLDTRCEPEICFMKEAAGDAVTEITGAPVTYAHGPKVLRWKRQYPSVYQKIRKFILPVPYVAGRLCGLKAEDAYIDYTCLHFSGFGDISKLCWSQQLLDTFAIDADKMPKIAAPWDVVGKISKQAAAQTGLAEGTILCAGAGDQAATSLGAGITKPGLAFDVAGTASVFSCCTKTYAPDVGNQTALFARSILPDLWIPLSYIGGGGLCVRWIRDTLAGTDGSVTYDTLAQEAESIAPGSSALLFVPHFAGRVCPNDPYVRGSFIGLGMRHTRAHLYRAVLESIGYEYAMYNRILRECTHEPCNEVYGIGGGSKSALFNQIKADILGVPYSVLQTSDTGALGMSVVAGYAAGLYDDIAETAQSHITKVASFVPDAERNKQYEHYSRMYPQALTLLRDIYKQL